MEHYLLIFGPDYFYQAIPFATLEMCAEAQTLITETFDWIDNGIEAVCSAKGETT